MDAKLAATWRIFSSRDHQMVWKSFDYIYNGGNGQLNSIAFQRIPYDGPLWDLCKLVGTTLIIVCCFTHLKRIIRFLKQMRFATQHKIIFKKRKSLKYIIAKHLTFNWMWTVHPYMVRHEPLRYRRLGLGHVGNESCDVISGIAPESVPAHPSSPLCP